MSDRRKRSPFIPAWLDDLNLTANEFRVLCHLWRRAGSDGVCFPGGDSIRKACRVSDPTLWAVLRKLESRGLLERRKRFSNSNSYRMMVPSWGTQNETVTQSGSLKSEGLQSLKSEGLGSLKSEGCKGSPMKVPHLRIDLAEAVAPAEIAEEPKKDRPRNLLLDSLVTLDGGALAEVTKPAWGAAAKALKEIKAASPDVTPEEIYKRAGNYRREFKGMKISPSSLAKWWSSMGKGSAPQKSKLGW